MQRCSSPLAFLCEWPPQRHHQLHNIEPIVSDRETECLALCRQQCVNDAWVRRRNRARRRLVDRSAGAEQLIDRREEGRVCTNAGEILSGARVSGADRERVRRRTIGAPRANVGAMQNEHTHNRLAMSRRRRTLQRRFTSPRPRMALVRAVARHVRIGTMFE